MSSPLPRMDLSPEQSMHSREIPRFVLRISCVTVIEHRNDENQPILQSTLVPVLAEKIQLYFSDTMQNHVCTRASTLNS